MDVSPGKSEEGKSQNEYEPVSSGQTESARTRGRPRISGFWAAAPSEGSGRGEASGSLPEVPGRLQRACHGRATGTGQSGWRAARAQVPLPLQTMMTPPHTPSGDWGEMGSVLRPHTYQG